MGWCIQYLVNIHLHSLKLPFYTPSQMLFNVSSLKCLTKKFVGKKYELLIYFAIFQNRLQAFSPCTTLYTVLPHVPMRSQVPQCARFPTALVAVWQLSATFPHAAVILNITYNCPTHRSFSQHALITAFLSDSLFVF